MLGAATAGNVLLGDRRALDTTGAVASTKMKRGGPTIGFA